MEAKPAVSLIALAAALSTLAIMVLLMFLPSLKPWRGVSADDKIAQKKIEDLRAADRGALDSYDGPFVDPSHTQVRIPIDRAMRLLAEESASSIGAGSASDDLKHPVTTSTPTVAPSAPAPFSTPQPKTDPAPVNRPGGDPGVAGPSREPRP